MFLNTWEKLVVMFKYPSSYIQQQLGTFNIPIKITLNINFSVFLNEILKKF